MTRTLRLVNMLERQDFDELQVREDDIGPGENTSDWIKVSDAHGEEFLCSLTVVEALLWIGRSHAEDEP